MKVYNFKSSKPAEPKSWKKKITKRLRNLNWPIIGKWGFRLGAAGILFIAFLFIYYSQQLPDPNRLLGRDVPESTKIYAADGTLLYEVHGEIKRTLIELDQVSPYLKNATLAAEDQNFYNHSGISFRGLARSVLVNITSGSKRQGGSTITQQFVKNAVLTREKSYIRKVKEIIISIELEARFSKDDIFKLYLNEIPYGRNAYGIEAAAKTYFDKSANDLTLAESAYLAALPQAPSYYNPSGPNFDDLQARQRYILAEMEDLGMISAEEKEAALNENVEFQQIKTAITAAHFVQYVENYLAEQYGEQTLQEGGLKVYTTLDTKMQEIAERVVREGAARNASSNGANAALVAMNPKNGHILAMVGSKDYFGESEPEGCAPGKSCVFEPNVNVATTLQQPGSSFKPYAYVTAFTKDYGYSPATMLMDVVTNFGDYTPKNFDLGENGPVSMRTGLAGSLNIPAVKTLALVGPENVIETARDLGIDAPFRDCGLALVLGGCDVKLIDHTAAYATLANMGKRVEKTAILKIESKEGEILEEYEEDSKQVLDPQAVYQLINVMTDNSARAFVFGNNSPLTLGNRPVAAKTGTTQEFRDGWTMGFTPSLAAGVWTGNNNNKPMTRDAVYTAGPIWNAFMREALADTPIEQFEQPDGIEFITVDKISGKLPTQYTPETKREVFASYNKPKDYDDVHQLVTVDTRNGLPATDSTPSEYRGEEVYTVLHSIRPKNSAWETPVVRWALDNGFKYPPGSGIDNVDPGESNRISFTNPLDNQNISGTPFPVSVSVDGDVSKLDILIDGVIVHTFESQPFSTNINRALSSGPHKLSARATFTNGGTALKTININIGGSSGLDLYSPGNNETLSFPEALRASSSNEYNGVSFYYQSGNQTTKIGEASTREVSDGYRYTLTWDNPPPNGTYSIFARSSNGTESPKIRVVVDE